MADILETIIARKKEEVEELLSRHPIAELKSMAKDAEPPRDFAGKLVGMAKAQKTGVIAEIKKASPSKGIIRADFDPAKIAQIYESAGAACLSVLTDRDFFQGDLSYIATAKRAANLPAMRKDFIIDESQVYEARAAGADAILLIAKCLDGSKLQDLEGLAMELGMGVLLEIYDPAEIEKCQKLKTPLFGVNNRNLNDFKVNLNQTVDVLPSLQGRTVVSESGISSRADVEYLNSKNVWCFLVGESLMREEDPGAALKKLLCA